MRPTHQDLITTGLYTVDRTTLPKVDKCSIENGECEEGKRGRGAKRKLIQSVVCVCIRGGACVCVVSRALYGQ